MDNIEVRVVMIPGVAKTVVIPAESTVADALQAANVTLRDPDAVEGIKLDGLNAESLDQPVGQDSRVIVAKDAVGNS